MDDIIDGVVADFQSDLEQAIDQFSGILMINFALSEKFSIMSGLYFHPPITIINSKKIIKLTISPTGI